MSLSTLKVIKQGLNVSAITDRSVVGLLCALPGESQRCNSMGPLSQQNLNFSSSACFTIIAKCDWSPTIGLMLQVMSSCASAACHEAQTLVNQCKDRVEWWEEWDDERSRKEADQDQKEAQYQFPIHFPQSTLIYASNFAVQVNQVGQSWEENKRSVYQEKSSEIILTHRMHCRFKWYGCIDWLLSFCFCFFDCKKHLCKCVNLCQCV